MEKFLQARKEKKRKIEECWIGIQTVRAGSLHDIIQAGWQEDDILTFLVAKYGYSTLEIAKYALQNFPPQNLCPGAAKAGITVLPMIVESGVPEAEAEQYVELLSACTKFLAFDVSRNYGKKSKKKGATLLTPPNHLVHDGCLVCASELKTHNDLCAVTIFTIDGPCPAQKVCWRCSGCGLNYNYSMYGNNASGYRFYKEPRPLVEASAVTFVERLVCNYQIHLA